MPEKGLEKIKAKVTKKEIQKYVKILNKVVSQYLVNSEDAINLCVDKLIAVL